MDLETHVASQPAGPDDKLVAEVLGAMKPLFSACKPNTRLQPSTTILLVQ